MPSYTDLLNAALEKYVTKQVVENYEKEDSFFRFFIEGREKLEQETSEDYEQELNENLLCQI